MEKIRIEITGFKMISHLAMTNIHYSLHIATIIALSESSYYLINGKDLIKESHVEKNKNCEFEFSNAKDYFYLNEINSPVFDSFDKFLEFYNLILINHEQG